MSLKLKEEIFMNVTSSTDQELFMKYSSPFSKRQILDSSKLKVFTGDNFKVDENNGSSLKRYKTLWKKEKLLVTSNFSFSQGVFKRLLLQTCKKKGLFGEGLKSEKFLISSILFPSGKCQLEKP